MEGGVILHLHPLRLGGVAGPLGHCGVECKPGTGITHTAAITLLVVNKDSVAVMATGNTSDTANTHTRAHTHAHSSPT